MSDNEMLKNAVKALEKKYSGNGFVAVDNEGALMDARRENKAYFLVIPVDKTVHSKKDAANVFFLADSKSKMIGYMFDRRKDIDAMAGKLLIYCGRKSLYQLLLTNSG